MKIVKPLLITGLVAVGLGTITFPLFYVTEGFGSRGTYPEYSFQHRNEPATVMREDIRWGHDQYWIKLDDRTKIKEGCLSTDENKTLRVGMNYYSLKDYVEGDCLDE